MKNIMTCLWFDGNAEEAVDFYLSVFKDGKRGKTAYYGDYAPNRAGEVLTVTFTIMGLDFMALNGGPEFKFTPAISLLVPCKTQGEIDYYWDKLIEGGGKPVQCGWLEDRFGLSWQVAPANTEERLTSGNQDKIDSMMRALTGMIKLDMAALDDAYNKG